MATVLESLKGVSAYPIPFRTLESIVGRRGITLTDEASQERLGSEAYSLALADVLLWLSSAPNVSQGGQSYSFSDEQRTQFRNRANALFAEFGADNGANKPVFGYKGSRL